MSPTASATSNTVTSGAPSTASTSPADPLASEGTFLTLLVSQLQNQDPVDSNTFVSQLTAYSQLEQLMGINQNTSTIATDVTPAASATPATGTTQPATQPTT